MMSIVDSYFPLIQRRPFWWILLILITMSTHYQLWWFMKFKKYCFHRQLALRFWAISIEDFLTWRKLLYLENILMRQKVRLTIDFSLIGVCEPCQHYLGEIWLSGVCLKESAGVVSECSSQYTGSLLLKKLFLILSICSVTCAWAPFHPSFKSLLLRFLCLF